MWISQVAVAHHKCRPQCCNRFLLAVGLAAEVDTVDDAFSRQAPPVAGGMGQLAKECRIILCKIREPLLARHADLIAKTTAPTPIIKISSHSHPCGRSPRKAKANTATKMTLSLSIGSTLEASPTFNARAYQTQEAQVANPEAARKTSGLTST